MTQASSIGERLLALERTTAAHARRLADLEALEVAAPRPPEPAMAPDMAPAVDELAGLLNPRLAQVLAAAGYESVAGLRAATDTDLLAIDGVAERSLALIRERLAEAN